MKSLIILLASLLYSAWTLAAIDTYSFTSPEQEQQYRDITHGLRCPKCQNNSIADSNAMIAADMRLKVYELLQQGQTPAQITDYMVARYGHFVTYNPPLEASTLVLWLGPLLFVVGGGMVIVLRSRRRRDTAPLNADEQARLAALLGHQEKKP
ncbi:cytochrome c-type biogenesis protein CcmH [Enterobacterales bacterium CwR94]|nr:cytochrome c-type biogenesis protein CcmH [Enterobacterales bacterium CwR94]